MRDPLWIEKPLLSRGMVDTWRHNANIIYNLIHYQQDSRHSKHEDPGELKSSKMCVKPASFYSRRDSQLVVILVYSEPTLLAVSALLILSAAKRVAARLLSGVSIHVGRDHGSNLSFFQLRCCVYKLVKYFQKLFP